MYSNLSITNKIQLAFEHMYRGLDIPKELKVDLPVYVQELLEVDPDDSNTECRSVGA